MRFVSEEDRRRLFADDRPAGGAVLHDGFVCAAWRIERDRSGDPSALVVEHVSRLPKRAQAAIAAEGRRLLGFLELPLKDVRFVRLG